MKIFSILCFLLCSITFSNISLADSTAIESVNQEQKQKQIEQVNINTASAEELTKVLNGIGASKAQKIIEYREKFGPFISVEQLKEVSGIGQATLDKNLGKIIL
ncbi:ComEA family DNA-binding protein [Gilliamella sp. wkB112]|uniref:ComEA family DNA-binding protein n=1 Tax=Gilliamella sp. wkB112 TaxID=3120257 RepID=UPI00080DAF06|nr:ComEA family DNA-binding protein [Gilliamella apicola]OCG04713.1 hypothetical protein A9G12_06810 [Gilliamella apicola]